MSKEMPLVVYAGEASRGEMLAERTAELGWTVLIATQERQALGMWVFYMPDLIVIDGTGNASGAQSVYDHLCSVAAAPLLLLSTRDFHPLVDGEKARSLSAGSTESDIILVAAALLDRAMAF